MKTVNGMK